MARVSARSGGKEAPSKDAANTNIITTAGGSPALAAPQTISSGQTPRTIGVGNSPKAGKVNARYPMREVTYYQMSRSDFRSMGVAQAAATICAAIGTWAMSNYLELSKDIALAKGTIPEWLYSVRSMAFWAWLIFWCIALAAFAWQGFEYHRIRTEHGELGFWQKAGKWISSIRS